MDMRLAAERQGALTSPPVEVPAGEVSRGLAALGVDHGVFSCIAEEVWCLPGNGIERAVHRVVNELTDWMEDVPQPAL